MKNEISAFIILLSVAGVFHLTLSWAQNQEEDISTAEIKAMAAEKLEQARLIETPSVNHAQQTESAQLWALYKNLYESPGSVLFQGKKVARLGNLEIKNYRLEEINLPRPWKTKIKNQDVTTNKAWRLTIAGGPFPVRDMPLVIWVGDTAIGYGQENFDLSEISAVTPDNSGLTEGAPIAISYGMDGPREVLPEKLSFGEAIRR